MLVQGVMLSEGQPRKKGFLLAFLFLMCVNILPFLASFYGCSARLHKVPHFPWFKIKTAAENANFLHGIHYLHTVLPNRQTLKTTVLHVTRIAWKKA